MASAHVLFNILGCTQSVITFDSLSGKLAVSRTGDLLTLDFPVQIPTACAAPDWLVTGLGRSPLECFMCEDYIAVFENEQDVLAVAPNYEALHQLDLRGVIITAPSSEYDFVARFFAPQLGIPEDPVTGSAYTQLLPYWEGRLKKSKLYAKQLSSRGGELVCERNGNRVLISGGAVTYMEGSIYLDA